MPASSKADPLLAKANPINSGGSASGITDLTRTAGVMTGLERWEELLFCASLFLVQDQGVNLGFVIPAMPKYKDLALESTLRRAKDETDHPA
ncbi:hypothetical protein WISP_138786 [Willisornis vidua]|uniref:Uncharacterized protein n=1 Tax=Willisornis vidua TaxID=1566151 RepID=A0ABQ9CMN6_9PASS|nr:hypothetical protein WISP_138786 [Willisornis vidua]